MTRTSSPKTAAFRRRKRASAASASAVQYRDGAGAIPVSRFVSDMGMVDISLVRAGPEGNEAAIANNFSISCSPSVAFFFFFFVFGEKN